MAFQGGATETMGHQLKKYLFFSDDNLKYYSFVWIKKGCFLKLKMKLSYIKKKIYDVWR